MCVPGCLETVGRRLGRRQLIGGAGLALAAGAASVMAPPARAVEPKSFSRVVDLTHAMGPDFPTYDGGSNLGMETLVTLAKDGYNMKRWLLVEHTGTHMDAPIHFGDGVQSADQIPVEDLVVPLVVVDIRAKAQENADAELTPDDLRAFEAEHGPIPAGACVAMLSGWDARAGGPEFRNADGEGVMHFPGFHVEAAQYLMGAAQRRRHRGRHALARLRQVPGLRHALRLAADQPLGAGGGREPGRAAAGRRDRRGRRPQDQGGDRRPEPGTRPALAVTARAAIGLPIMALPRWTRTRLQIVAVVAVIAGAVGLIISWLLSSYPQPSL